jgi:hypothetical protein
MRFVALVDGRPPGREVERRIDGDEDRGGAPDGGQDLIVVEQVGGLRGGASEDAEPRRSLRRTGQVQPDDDRLFPAHGRLIIHQVKSLEGVKPALYPFFGSIRI